MRWNVDMKQEMFSCYLTEWNQIIDLNGVSFQPLYFLHTMVLCSESFQRAYIIFQRWWLPHWCHLQNWTVCLWSERDWRCGLTLEPAGGCSVWVKPWFKSGLWSVFEFYPLWWMWIENILRGWIYCCFQRLPWFPFHTTISILLAFVRSGM